MPSRGCPADQTKCIGCKAWGRGMEWSDLRDEIGINAGVYDNPPDFQPILTVMPCRVREPRGGSRVAHPQGRLHALRRPGMPQGSPSPGAIVQYANGIVDFQEENCIGCGYCISGCRSMCADFEEGQRSQVHAVFRSRCGRLGITCVKAHPTGCITFGSKDQLQHDAAERVELNPRVPTGRTSTIRKASAAPVMYVLHHATTRPCTADCRRSRRSAHLSDCGKGLRNPWRWAPWPSLLSPAS
jgi:formate dehydrogenase iron-sulfur subunit